ncbi:hypothetical protein [Streptomyces sp. NPDC051546]|uniref:hypothetical protein n=1 Tax=Streptomyces sp. NPDC051546 TaxID=3365655 RepID=UPI00379A88DA
MSLYPEVRRGGNLPFGQSCNAWMCDPRYSANCRTLYGILVSYADTGTRDTRRGRPYRPELARQLGCSLSTLDRTLFEGEVAGLWTVRERKNPNNPELHDANVYELHDAALMYAGQGEWIDPLPAGVLAADVAKQRIEERRAAKREAGEVRKGGVAKGVSTKKLRAARASGGPDAGEFADGGGAPAAVEPSPESVPREEGGGSTGAARGSSTGAAGVAARVLPNVYNPVYNPDPEPEMPGGSAAGHSAGGFTRAGARDAAGGQTPAGPGGSAAIQKKVSSKGARRRGAQQLAELVPVAGEEEVYAMLDVLGVLGSPASRIKTVRRAVRELLGHSADARPTAFSMYPRTPAHALARIDLKWHRTGAALRAAQDYTGPDRIRRPVGYLARILTEQDCALPNCELGVLDTGAECGQCGYRAAERIGTAFAARHDADLAAAQKHERAAASERHRAEIDAVYEVAAAENEQWDRTLAARAAELEETVRLREQLAAEYPELATVAPAVMEVPGPRDGGAGYAQTAGRGRRAAEEQRARAALVAEGMYGTALDEELRRHMAAWRADRHREAEAADVAAIVARSVGAWPSAGYPQPQEAPF